MLKSVLIRVLFLLITVLPVSTYAYDFYVDVEPEGNGSGSFPAVYFHLDQDGLYGYDPLGAPGNTDGWEDMNPVGQYSWAYGGAFELEFYGINDNGGNLAKGPYLFSTYGFCVEIFIPAGDGLATLAEVSSDGMIAASWLMDSYWSTSNDVNQNAGLQLAIWEVLYPGTIVPFAVGSGYYSHYTTYASGVGSADLSNFSTDKFRVVTFDDNQNMLTTVPEPATMFLMGLGLIGVAGMGIKRRKI